MAGAGERARPQNRRTATSGGMGMRRRRWRLGAVGTATVALGFVDSSSNRENQAMLRGAIIDRIPAHLMAWTLEHHGLDGGIHGLDGGTHGLDEGTHGLDGGTHGLDEGTHGLDGGTHGLDRGE